MRLITEKYREINREIHGAIKNYGKNSLQWVPHIWKLIEEGKIKTILDYGCGKGVLSLNIPYFISNYDPGVVQFEEMPSPAELVVCTNVLECVEPEYLEYVIDHLNFLTEGCLFLTICTKAAPGKLLDGRNFHLNVKTQQEWEDLISKWFVIKNRDTKEDEFLLMCQPRVREELPSLPEVMDIPVTSNDVSLNQINIGGTC